MPLNIDEVRQIAALSRLRIEVEAEQRWTLQLATIVDHVVSLSAANAGASAADEEGRSLPERADAAEPSLEADRFLRNAPDRFRGYFAVPRILGG